MIQEQLTSRFSVIFFVMTLSSKLFTKVIPYPYATALRFGEIGQRVDMQA